MASIVSLTDHAARACLTRELPADVVLEVARRKLADLPERESYAVHVGRVKERGSLIGSNGSEVWAIVRDRMVSTIMLRRLDQPATRVALRVADVVL